MLRMPLASMLQPQRAWCAIVSFNPSKRFSKGSLCGANCCRSCSFPTKMRSLQGTAMHLDVPLQLSAQLQGQDAVLGHPGCLCCCVSCLTLLSVLRQAQLLPEQHIPLWPTSPHLLQLPPWPICLFRLWAASASSVMAVSTIYRTKLLMGAVSAAAASTALGAPSSLAT